MAQFCNLFIERPSYLGTLLCKQQCTVTPILYSDNCKPISAHSMPKCHF